MRNRHSCMQAIGIFTVVAILCLASCSNSGTKKASKRLQTAQLYARNGQFSNALLEIDSIHTLYPKAVDIRRQAKYLSDSIAYVEAVRTYHYSDSVRGELIQKADELIKKFRYEKNPAYEDHGKYVHKLLQTTGNNTSRCYLQCYIGDDRTTTLKSYYYGTKRIDQRHLELSSQEENISKEGATHVFENEGWHEIMSFEEEASLALLNFISAHRQDRIRVRLEGNSPYIYYLQENERTALDDTYHLGILMHDIKQLEDAMRTADRTMGKWEHKRDGRNE